MEYNAIRIISVQSKVLKGHITKMRDNLNYALKEANDEKLTQKKIKYQVLDLQDRMDITILRISALQNSTSFNMQQLNKNTRKR